MITALSSVSMHVQHLCSGEETENSQKNVFRIALVLDMLLGLGAILSIYFVNKGKGFDLPEVTVAVTYSGIAECCLALVAGFWLISKNKI